VSTYADTDASKEENRIDTIYIMIKQGNSIIDARQIPENASSPSLQKEPNTNDSMIIVKYEVETLPTGTLDVEVFANHKDVRKLNDPDSIPLPKSTETAFFMSGKGTLLFDVTAYTATIHLIRNVAKVRVNISRHPLFLPSDLEIDYDQIVIGVLNVTDTTSLFANTTITDVSKIDYIDYPDRGYGTLFPLQHSPTFHATNSPAYSAADGGQIDSFYVYENFRNDITFATKIKLTIPISSSQGAKVFSRTYELISAAGNPPNYTLLRNYIYTFDVKVRAPSLDPVITVSIQPWNDVDVNGDIYGTYLTVNSSEIVFDSKGKASVDFCTDAQAVYFKFKDFPTGVKFGAGSGNDIITGGIEAANGLQPAGFDDGYMLLDQQHCGNFTLDINPNKKPAFPAINFSGKICMRAGNIEKCLSFPRRTFDAHFIVGDSIFGLNDEYTYAEVNMDGGGSWLSISENRIYNQSDMHPSYSGAAKKLYLHLDENLSGAARTGSVTVTDAGGTTKELRLIQLPAIPVGRFGYAAAVPTNDSVYDRMLYTEQLYEFNTMPIYSESGAASLASANSIYNGRWTATSSGVFNWANYSPNFSYQNEVNKAINYCAYKNRITASGDIKDEVKWYLPAQAQLLGMWLSYNSYKDIATSNFKIPSPSDLVYGFWSSTENAAYNTESQLINFKYGNVGHYYKNIKYWARCVRDYENSSSSSMILTNNAYPVIDFGNGMPSTSYTTTGKNNGEGDENSDYNKTLYKTLRVAVSDAFGTGRPWTIDLCNNYSEDGTGWRLPTQRELQAIWILQSEIKRKFSGFNLLSDNYYWSATTASSGGSNVWTIYGSRIEAGSSGNMPNQAKTEQLRVRCVREVAP
jgi:hypothetical protein